MEKCTGRGGARRGRGKTPLSFVKDVPGGMGWKQDCRAVFGLAKSPYYFTPLLQGVGPCPACDRVVDIPCECNEGSFKVLLGSLSSFKLI